MSYSDVKEPFDININSDRNFKRKKNETNNNMVKKKVATSIKKIK